MAEEGDARGGFGGALALLRVRQQAPDVAQQTVDGLEHAVQGRRHTRADPIDVAVGKAFHGPAEAADRLLDAVTRVLKGSRPRGRSCRNRI